MNIACTFDHVCSTIMKHINPLIFTRTERLLSPPREVYLAQPLIQMRNLLRIRYDREIIQNTYEYVVITIIRKWDDYVLGHVKDDQKCIADNLFRYSPTGGYLPWLRFRTLRTVRTAEDSCERAPTFSHENIHISKNFGLFAGEFSYIQTHTRLSSEQRKLRRFEFLLHSQG